MQRRKFIKTIAAASAAVAAPIAIIHEHETEIWISTARKSLSEEIIEQFSKPEIYKPLIELMGEGRTIVDILDKNRRIYLDTFSWND